MSEGLHSRTWNDSSSSGTIQRVLQGRRYFNFEKVASTGFQRRRRVEYILIKPKGSHQGNHWCTPLVFLSNRVNALHVV